MKCDIVPEGKKINICYIMMTYIRYKTQYSLKIFHMCEILPARELQYLGQVLVLGY